MTPQSAGTSSSKHSAGPDVWALADLIDIEVLVKEDAGIEHDRPGRLRERDREIYKQFAQHSGNKTLQDRRWLFRFWLEVRRRDRFRDNPSPGEEILSVIFWVRVTLLLAGVLIARGAIWSFFRGVEATAARPEPINVLWYGLACIAIPFLLSLYGFWVFLGQKAAPKLPAAPPFLRGALFRLIQPLLRRTALRVSENLGAGNQMNAHAVVGALKQRIESRRTAIGAAVFHLVQMLGVGFTAGVLLFSWAECEFHSRVFGWQTTDREMTAASVHRCVKILALPWQWLKPEGLGSPTLAQVEGTRFIRYQDAGQLPPDAAPVWASFLIWCAFIYGLAPRLFLERLSSLQIGAILKRETFEELRFDALWERMTLERGTFEPPKADAPEEVATAVPHAPEPFVGTSACQLIFPAEIQTPERVQAIEAWLKARKGWDAATVIAMRSGLAEKEQVIAKLRKCLDDGANLKILIVQEAFMPPVQQFIDFIKSMRSAVGAKHAILVGLVGKPDGTPLARPPKANDFDVWSKKIAALGDPNLDAISFITPA